MRREIAKLYPPSLRGAKATKQSMSLRMPRYGLLRFARNDVERAGPASFETALSRLLRMRSETLMVRSAATPRVSNHEATKQLRRRLRDVVFAGEQMNQCALDRGLPGRRGDLGAEQIGHVEHVAGAFAEGRDVG